MTEPLIDTLKIEFTIPGTPQQQGSKIVSRYGGMYDANKKLAAWRTDAIAAAQAAWHGPKIIGPVAVEAIWYFSRPQSHYGTGRNRLKIKDSAPTWHAQAPDADKLARSLGDALTQSGVLADDKLIVSWYAYKLWTSEAPRTEVRVTIIGDQQFTIGDRP